MRRFCRSFLVLALYIPMVFCSCHRTDKPTSEELSPKAQAINKEYREGPFGVRLMADRDSLNIAESVVLTIEAEMDDGYVAELPKFGEKLNDFGIRDYREDQAQITPQGKIVTRKVYTLDPFLSGDYTIAPMQVRFRKKTEIAPGGQNGTAGVGSEEHELTTEAITIKVNSLLDKDRQELALNPIKGPVSLPAGPIPMIYVVACVGAVLVLATGTLLVVRRRRWRNRQGASPALPAHALAHQQLQDILDEKLLERGEFKLFFSKISDVLRSYIENRFGLHAPKRTTEEFLADISRGAPFSVEDRQLLIDFLRDCDLVKFAEHQPSPDDIDAAIDSCKAFIDATKSPVAEEPRPHA